MTGPIWVLLALSAAAVITVGALRLRASLSFSIAVAFVLRVAFAAMTSEKFTPRDVRVYFRSTGEAVLHGHDPLSVLPGRQWNFLELMPYIHALELQSGLSWVYAVKIVPIICDVAIVWMIAQLAPAAGLTRALQYALNPLSLLIVSLHGQVEPVALVLALGGTLLLRKDRPVAAGILLGAAIAAKTWPVFILLAVLPVRDVRRVVRVVGSAAVVPFACLLSGVLFLHTSVSHDLSRLASYSGFVAIWTWSGLLLELGAVHTGGYDSPVGVWGSRAIIVGVCLTLYFVRRCAGEARALCVLCAALSCTAGFGVQYLMWTFPLMMAMSGNIRNLYMVSATGWAAVFYLSPFIHPNDQNPYLQAFSWLPAALLVAVIMEQIRLNEKSSAHEPNAATAILLTTRDSKD